MQERQYEIAVPTVCDRIVPALVKIMLEPVFDADSLPRGLRVPHEAVGARSWRKSAILSVGCSVRDLSVDCSASAGSVRRARSGLGS
jgi:hypothetical protein